MLTMAVRFQVQMHPKRRMTMEFRNVEHQYSSDDFDTLARDTNTALVYRAIGYLSTWGGFKCVRLQISVRDGLEITARYTNPGDLHAGYVIAAVWHDDHFGFHS
jgi:hypothetical protein